MLGRQLGVNYFFLYFSHGIYRLVLTLTQGSAERIPGFSGESQALYSFVPLIVLSHHSGFIASVYCSSHYS